MGNQVVHGGEFDATRGADKLDQGRRGRTGRWWTVAHRRLPRLAVVLLMGDEILMPAKHNVALLASANIPSRISQSPRLGISDSSHTQIQN